MNNADLLVATLRAAGIRRGFGIPSGNVLPLMEAMRKGGVDFVLTAHEGSAGFAADVTGRMTGAPGLCIATLAAAIKLALTEPQGPVHLDLPEDVALAQTNEPVPVLSPPGKLAPAADAAVAHAAKLIDAARRPIAVIGASAMHLPDPGELLRVVAHFHLPFAAT